MRERRQHLAKTSNGASLRPEKRAWKGVALGVGGQNQHVVFVKRQWAAAPTPCMPIIIIIMHIIRFKGLLETPPLAKR